MLRAIDIKLVKVIGSGAFGKVYLIHLTAAPNKFYAVKILKTRKILKMRQVDQVNNEISTLKTLFGSKFITKLISPIYEKDFVGLVMEYVDGGELFYWLRKFSKFSPHATLFYVCEVVSALKFIHNRSIIYRDLKPENILLTSDGHLKLTDFGFSMHTKDKIYVISGTPEYMSPEKLLGEGDGFESDYWALGVIVFEMLSGDPPFYDRDSHRIYKKILSQNVLPPKYINPNARDLILRLLDKNRNTRLGYGGIDEIIRHHYFDLVDWEAVQEQRTRPPFTPKQCAEPFESYYENTESESSSDNEPKPYGYIKKFDKTLYY